MNASGSIRGKLTGVIAIVVRSVARSIRARPVLWFVPLALLLSWYPELLGRLGMEASGINPLGALAAALIVAGVAGGRNELKALLARVVRIRAPVRWYLLALLLMPALAFAALAIAMLSGVPAPTSWGRWPDRLESLVVMFFFVGLGEEPAWRGFMLTTLQRTRSALASAMLVGIVWAVWHAPFYGGELPAAQVLPFVLSVLAASVILAWMFGNTGGSVPVCMLAHAVTNALGGGYVAQLLHGDDLTRWWWIYAAVCLLAAGAIAVLCGQTLRRQAPLAPSIAGTA